MQTVTNVYEILHASPCDCFQFRNRLRLREPSRIPALKTYLILMSKNKKAPIRGVTRGGGGGWGFI